MKVQIWKVKCDRCGAENSEHDPDHVRQAWEQMKLSGASPARDLCPHCTISLSQWFKAFAPKQGESVHDGN